MTTLLAALFAILALAGTAYAGDPDACAVAQHLVQADAPLPRAAAAISGQHRLNVVVVGSASVMLPGPNGARMAFPARLSAALGSRLSGVDLKVVPVARPRQTAADMAGQFDQILAGEKPDLVVWQTGIVDAIRGVDVEEFRTVLDRGVETLQKGGTDVVIMNMQFSPRTESMIAAGAYLDTMRFVALQREVPLFDRFAVMKHWSELGTFDLSSPTRTLDTAGRVHDCIGRLLADLIVQAVKLAAPGAKEIR